MSDDHRLRFDEQGELVRVPRPRRRSPRGIRQTTLVRAAQKLEHNLRKLRLPLSARV